MNREAVIGASNFFMGVIILWLLVLGLSYILSGRRAYKADECQQDLSGVEILVHLLLAMIIYLFVGYGLSYDTTFSEEIAIVFDSDDNSALTLMRHIQGAVYCAVVPVSLWIAFCSRISFVMQCVLTGIIVGFAYPLLERVVWGGNINVQNMMFHSFGATIHDFGGALVVHSLLGLIAIMAVKIFGGETATGEETREGAKIWMNRMFANPFYITGLWVLSLTWFGMLVFKASTTSDFELTKFVALNGAMAASGGVLTALLTGQRRQIFSPSVCMASIVAVSAGADIVHPTSAFMIGVLTVFFCLVSAKRMRRNRFTIGAQVVWIQHGVPGLWGVTAAGIFGSPLMGGRGEVELVVQLIGAAVCVMLAFFVSVLAFGAVRLVHPYAPETSAHKADELMGCRNEDDPAEEFDGLPIRRLPKRFQASYRLAVESRAIAASRDGWSGPQKMRGDRNVVSR